MPPPIVSCFPPGKLVPNRLVAPSLVLAKLALCYNVIFATSYVCVSVCTPESAVREADLPCFTPQVGYSKIRKDRYVYKVSFSLSRITSPHKSAIRLIAAFGWVVSACFFLRDTKYINMCVDIKYKRCLLPQKNEP